MHVYLSQRLQKTKVGSTYSKLRSILFGVPQRSIWATFSYNLYLRFIYSQRSLWVWKLFRWYHFFFYQDFLSRTLTTHRSAGEERGPFCYFSTLPLPLAHEYSDIYVQLCTSDDYHIFLIAALVFTRLLLDEIYYLIEYYLIDWCVVDLSLFACWFN